MRTAKLFALFILAAAIAGCEKPEFIDFDTTPPEDRFDTDRDTLAITVSTIPIDTVVVWNGTLSDPVRRGFNLEYLGVHNDPEFGITRTSIATHIDLPGNATEFGNLPQADSAFLIIRYRGNFYGNINTPQTFEVYRVTERLYEEVEYYANSQISYDPTPIGTWTGTPNPLDTTFRIAIDTSFANIVIGGTEADYTNQVNFKNYINGLYIKPVSQGLAKGEGALIATNLANNQSRFLVYYKSASDTTPGNTLKTFPIVPQSVRLTLTERDYTGTEVATQLQSPGPNYEQAFLQPVGGLMVHVSLPGLRDFANAHPELVMVHRARLTVPRYSATPSDTLSPPERLYLFRARADSSNDYQNIIPDRTVTATFGGTYDKNRDQYAFHITRYVQEEYQKMLADPTYKSTGINIFIPSDFVERLVIATQNTSQGNPVRLEVIYSNVD